MKKKLLGFGAFLAAAALPFFMRRYHKKHLSDTLPDTDTLQPSQTDFKDEEHLIFCDESNLGKRLIQLENSINIRDIGGYTGLNGRKTLWGKVIRSEELAHLSDNDVAYFEKIGLKHIFDFRDRSKAERLPDRIPKTADYTQVPVLEDMPFNSAEIDFDDPLGIDKHMRKIYRFQVEHKASAYATILKVMTDPNAYPILYHCTNGKDRTGFMTALILLICGVPEATILSDYSLTNLTFDEAFETLGTIMADDINKQVSVSREKLRDFFGVKPAWLKIQLDYIRDHYGSVDAYLLDNTDLTQEDLDAIRSNMLEPAPEA